MKLSEKEKQIILKIREDEQVFLPIKSGVLKHDIFTIRVRHDYWEENSFLSKEEIDQMIILCAPKGTIFECYIDGGIEAWRPAEDNFDMYNLSHKWAKKNLESILDLKPTKKKSKKK